VDFSPSSERLSFLYLNSTGYLYRILNPIRRLLSERNLNEVSVKNNVDYFFLLLDPDLIRRDCHSGQLHPQLKPKCLWFENAKVGTTFTRRKGRPVSSSVTNLKGSSECIQEWADFTVECTGIPIRCDQESLQF